MSLRYLNAMRALEATVRLGSFRAAGEELNVTPAAVGQQVKKLENLLGCELLQRRSNGFTPTTRALRACRSLEAGLGHFRKALDILEDSDATQRLAITLVPSLAEHWLTPRIAEFLGKHPGIDFRIDSTHTEHYQPSDEFDFGLRYEFGINRAIDAVDLFYEWLVPVCRPEVAAKLCVERNDGVFGDAALLQVDRETDDRHWATWDSWGQAFGIEPPPEDQRIKFHHTTLALQSMFAGHGVHLAQLSIAVPALASGELVAPFGSQRCLRTGYPYRLYRFGSTQVPELHASFLDWMKAQAADTEARMRRFLAGD